MLGGFLAAGGRYVHALPEGRQAWFYAVSGELTVHNEEEVALLQAREAVAIKAGDEVQVATSSTSDAHFVLMATKPIHEPFVKHGPFW